MATNSVTRSYILIHRSSPRIVMDYTLKCTRSSDTSHSVTVTLSGTMKLPDSGASYDSGHSTWGIGFSCSSASPGDYSGINKRYSKVTQSGVSVSESWTINADSYTTISINSHCNFTSGYTCDASAAIDGFDDITAPYYSEYTPTPTPTPTPDPSHTAPSVQIDVADDYGTAASADTKRRIKYKVKSNDGDSVYLRVSVDGESWKEIDTGYSSSSWSNWTTISGSFKPSSYGVNTSRSYQVTAYAYCSNNTSGTYTTDYIWLEVEPDEGSGYVEFESITGSTQILPNTEYKYSCNFETYDWDDYYDNKITVGFGTSDLNETWKNEIDIESMTNYTGEDDNYNAYMNWSFTEGKYYVYAYVKRTPEISGATNIWYSDKLTVTVGEEPTGSQDVYISGPESGTTNTPITFTVSTSPDGWRTSADGNISYGARVVNGNEYYAERNVSGTTSHSHTVNITFTSEGRFRVRGFVDRVPKLASDWDVFDRWNSDSLYITITAPKIPTVKNVKVNEGMGFSNFSPPDESAVVTWDVENDASSTLTYSKVYYRLYDVDSSSWKELQLSSRYTDSILFFSKDNDYPGKTFNIFNLLTDAYKNHSVLESKIRVDLYDKSNNNFLNSAESSSFYLVFSPNNKYYGQSDVTYLYESRFGRTDDYDDYYRPRKGQLFLLDSPYQYGNKIQFTVSYNFDALASGILDGFVLRVFANEEVKSRGPLYYFGADKIYKLSDMIANGTCRNLDTAYECTFTLDAKEDLVRETLNVVSVRPYYQGPNINGTSTRYRGDEIVVKLVKPYKELKKPVISYPVGTESNPGIWVNRDFRLLIELPEDEDYDEYRYYDYYYPDAKVMSQYKYGELAVHIGGNVYYYSQNKQAFSTDIDAANTNNHKKKICINLGLLNIPTYLATFDVFIAVEKYNYFYTQDEWNNGYPWSEMSDTVRIKREIPYNSRIWVQPGDKILASHYERVYDIVDKCYKCYPMFTKNYVEQTVGDIIEGSNISNNGEYLKLYNTLKSIVDGINNYCSYASNRSSVKMGALPSFVPLTENITAEDTTTSSTVNGRNYVNTIISILDDYMK